jgi:cobalamin biosynthesis protein CbiG
MIALGVGYTSRCGAEELARLAEDVLQRAQGEGASGYVATLERKCVGGLLEVVAARLALTPVYVTEVELAGVGTATGSSDRVAAAVGTGSVAEAAALAAAGPGAVLEVAKTASRQATCAAARGSDHHATEEGSAP